jgi:hypothetical protein
MVSLLLATLTLPRIVSAQPGTTVITGLTVTTSPRANGMGGTAATLPSLDPAATIANPGQLGLFSLDNLFSASTFTPKTEWAPALFSTPENGFSITTSAMNAGINLKDVLSLPFGASVGFGYSRTYWDLGTWPVFDSYGNPLGAITMNDTYLQYSVGIGLEYVVRFGIGMNFKRITSRMPTVGPAGQFVDNTITPSATDFGMMINIPLVEVVSRTTGRSYPIAHVIKPFVDFTAVYVKSNVGDMVSYAGSLQSDPLPRTALLGLGVEGGLTAKAGNTDWRILSLALVHQAEDVLVIRHNDGTSEYKGALGDLSIGENLLIGRVTGNVLIRKGWEIGAGEFLSIRGGSVEGYGYDYSTSGYSICLGGLVRFLEFASPEIAGNPWAAFVGDHIDIQYHSATYGSTDSPLNGTTFKELNLVLRGFPW